MANSLTDATKSSRISSRSTRGRCGSSRSKGSKTLSGRISTRACKTVVRATSGGASAPACRTKRRPCLLRPLVSLPTRCVLVGDKAVQVGRVPVAFCRLVSPSLRSRRSLLPLASMRCKVGLNGFLTLCLPCLRFSPLASLCCKAGQGVRLANIAQACYLIKGGLGKRTWRTLLSSPGRT